jgi:hypothetical protein
LSTSPGAVIRWLHSVDDAQIEAQRLYARMGWVRVGTIPGYSLLPG